MKKVTIFTGVFLFAVFSLLNLSGFGQIPAKPNPPRLVNDFTGTLSAQELQMLEQKLVNYNDTTSTQFLVVLVNDLGGYDPADFAFRLGEEWGVGQQQYNNGAVILIKPKTQKSRGQAFIATGYGLEALIPDALSKRIVDQEMIPEFKNERYFDGIWRATDVMMGLASGAYAADDYNQEPSAAWFVPILVFAIIFFMMKARGSANHIGGKSNLPFWTALFLASQAGRSHGGSWQSFSGGRGGSGGFGGFGGGSFGGGGAGGSW
ncbi:MAG: TPM domain-containing protein [Bacteroidales bacterium]|jgi:uncharacterized protein|nr:TPM domain-containing protein [Bacteroidales bacterium]